METANVILSRRQAAQALTICERTLDRLIAAGRVRTVKLSVRRVGVPRSEIERLAAGEGVAA